MRAGVRVALDIGSVRIGVARSDATGTLAVPLAAIPAGDDSVAAVASVLQEWEATDVYVGLPLHMSGAEGPSAMAAREWAARLAERTEVPIRLIDERLSTVQAQRGFLASGRSTRESRSRIDSASAVIVLQSALDKEHGTGEPAGELVHHDTGRREGQ